VADGVMIIAVGNDGQFRQLCEELGVPELGTDPRFVSSSTRLVNRDEIEAIVQDLVRGFKRDDLIERLVKRGVPTGPVNTIQDIFEDPFIEARGTVHNFVRDGAKVPTVAYPGKFSETPTDYRHCPPRVGEQSYEILQDWLALNEAELDRLEKDGAIAQRRSHDQAF
jgi:crotonobetainyl-CoA:carnitine CoA-transferase CaiB-like acyl-CoA transferase